MGVPHDCKRFRRKWFDTAKDFYKKDLVAHRGCVNALEFSANGELLFSGGDDENVLMWKMDAAVIENCGKAPCAMHATHFSNIFCLAVDSENRRVLSGSNDHQVIVHDYVSGNPIDYFLHLGTVFSISLQPDNGQVFCTASDDGRVRLFDTRNNGGETMCLAQLGPSFQSVMFHPTQSVLVATANDKLGVHMWDTRKPKTIRERYCEDRGMAVRWNSNGTLLLCLRTLLPPLLIDPIDQTRRLEFDEDTYFNACTMKSCCFAGDRDQYILSGSDDFNVYMWKVPEPWPERKWVHKAHLTLRGHRSIVNQVRYCPNRELLVTSGVEKIIKVWSPYRFPGSRGNRDVATKRRPRLICSADACRRNPLLILGETSPDSVLEDKRMIHFFDSFIRMKTKDILGPCTVSQRYQRLIKKKRKLLAASLKERLPQKCTLSQRPHHNSSQFKRRSEEEDDIMSDSHDSDFQPELNITDTSSSASSPSSTSSSSNSSSNTSMVPAILPFSGSSSDNDLLS